VDLSLKVVCASQQQSLRCVLIIVRKIVMDNKETVPSQAEKMNPEEDASQLSPEVLDRIKHPPNMDDVLREQSPEERRGNPALTPEIPDEPSDEMISFTR